MRPHWNAFLAVLFLLCGLAFPITYSDYFYSTETDVTVTTEDFTFDGSDYSIVYFDGEPTFLVKDDEIVDDPSAISDAIYNYYIENYYPSEEDIAELKSLVDDYNASRNDGYDWKNQEEFACRGVLLTDKRIEMYGELLWCHDEESCEINAKLLYQAYHEYTGWNSFDDARVPLKEFAYASYGTDDILVNMSEGLDTMDENTVVDTLQYIEDSIPTLRDYIEDIEGTIFRMPRMDDPEDRDDCYLYCYGMCPSLDLDETILDELEDKAGELLGDLGPLAAHSETASSIHENTMARLDYYETSEIAEDYDYLFSPHERRGLEVEEYAEEVSSLVSNTSFSMKLDSFIELRVDIRDKIDSKEFDGLDEDIADYRNLTDDVKEDADVLYEVYNKSLISKNSAERILFEIGTKDLGPVETERYNELREEIQMLGEEFGNGLTPAKYEELEDDYSQITNDALALLGGSESDSFSKAMVYFRGFAGKVNGGIADLASSTNITEVEEIPENRYVTFGGFSLLVFLSFSSILFLVFLYLIKVHNYSKIKYVVLIAFVLGIIFIALFSGFLYVFMQKTSMDATMDEFLVDFNDRETVAVVVDSTLATDAERNAMSSCADGMAESMGENNKTVTIYYFEAGGSCKKVEDSDESTMSEDDCRAEIENLDSAIYLNPSETIESPRLYSTYFSKAEIYATSNYYNACPLSAIFE